MNKLLTDWLAALRSGKYVQGKGRLREDDSFCCLGVLCDVHNPELWRVENERTIYGKMSAAFPPIDVMDALELPREMRNDLININVIFEGEEWTVIGLNDRGVPHSKIADSIEAEYKKIMGLT